jgi:hypothetical protein
MTKTVILNEKDMQLKVYDEPFQAGRLETVVIQRGSQIITLTEDDLRDLGALIAHYLHS